MMRQDKTSHNIKSLFLSRAQNLDLYYKKGKKSEEEYYKYKIEVM